MYTENKMIVGVCVCSVVGLIGLTWPSESLGVGGGALPRQCTTG